MFKGNVILDHIDGTSNKFIIISPFIYENDKYVIQFTPKLQSDGASVPKIFWNIFPPISGKYMEAAILHDILYASHILSKKEADKIFLEAMKDLGVSWWKRNVMYYAVKFFAIKAWDEKTPQQIQAARKHIKVIRKDKNEKIYYRFNYWATNFCGLCNG